MMQVHDKYEGSEWTEPDWLADVGDTDEATSLECTLKPLNRWDWCSMRVIGMLHVEVLIIYFRLYETRMKNPEVPEKE